VTAPVWLRLDVVLAIHDAQLAEHGGSSGLRDRGLLESALARPQHLAAYGEPDIAALAAAYAFGIARNHPFVDGNKRTALVAMETFLALNGHDLAVDDAACVVTMLRLAAGELEEQALADWIRQSLTPA
jgi:death-on-curing protein